MKIRVGVIQMTSSDDCLANFSICQRLARQGCELNCNLLTFPECFHFISDKTKKDGLKSSIDIAENLLNGPTIHKYKQLAIETNAYLSLGGFPEISNDSKKVYNTHIVISPQGNIVETYRKVHLFDYEAGGLVESSFTVPGTEAKVADIVIQDIGTNNTDDNTEKNTDDNSSCSVKIGLSTCYDLRFPEFYQKLRSMQAQVMLVPSAFTHKTGTAHWHVLNRARAIETQSFVLAAAQSGYCGSRRSYGHALIIDPWGAIIAEGGEPKPEGELLVADLDLNMVEEIRQKMPISLHKRPDVYRS